jgi:glycosyltransferase involved in cell wall biosynthesis
MKIWSHTLVRNEEKYIWYAVMSVIDYMDKMLIWDTGSDDATVDIIKELKKRNPDKIDFRQVGKVDTHGVTKLREEMLKVTKADWFFILDGDEVWWEYSIRELTEKIKKDTNKMESIVSRFVNVVGDIYHYQDEKAGQYKIDNKKGNLTIRAMRRNIPGLTVNMPYPLEGYFDSKGKSVQERPAVKRIHLDTPAYLHFTHLTRSESRQKDTKVPARTTKLKHELGIPFPLDYYYPESFFKPRPDIVPCVLSRMGRDFYLKSLAYDLPRKAKRKLTEGFPDD